MAAHAELRRSGAVGMRTNLLARLGAFVALTKPRIIELLLITTVPTMFVAARQLPSARLIAVTLVGGTLAAGGANAFNMVIDRDIDSVMERTKSRPLVTGAVSPLAAALFAGALEVLAFVVLDAGANLLSALLALSAAAFYVGVYTMWLKRSSSQNIVIGGAAGAVPVLVGWAAVRGSLGLTPLLLFGIVVLWTPPHFWALAVRYRDDYERAKVPMLPVVADRAAVVRQIVAYTAALWGLSIAAGLVGHLGIGYLVAAVALGGIFLARAVSLRKDDTPRAAMRLFGYSISYLTVIFIALGIDAVIAHP